MIRWQRVLNACHLFVLLRLLPKQLSQLDLFYIVKTGVGCRKMNSSVSDQERFARALVRLAPDASEALLLAARSQHVCRWLIPRDNFPMTRAGYLKWRAELKTLHSRKSAEILKALDYPDDVIAAVQTLNLKRNFPENPD